MFCSRSTLCQATQAIKRCQIRSLSSLEGHPHIYVFQNDGDIIQGNSHILSLLPTEPPSRDLAIGSTTRLPPTPESFQENPAFLKTLQEVLSKHAHEDPDAISQAQVMASTSGANLGSGGVLMAGHHRRRRRGENDMSSGASGQGGVGSAGRGGWIHISDNRRPPEYGRIAWPEDIFGSLEVDGKGQFVDGNGNYQSSGTYRIVTNNGILGLSPFLREKLVQRLREQEA
ncbi:hypothetical protein ASPZODRAFT_129710 [Penicilliopsis zonata CBS 506.65]|uniref:Uncharacterized protein n=1 Tax=Penicilliopsis zonata CBS 506.65 TaxID=1073090 RepID=A0A1L9SPV1_9EURO|nr:hypothetical protein ASPZODRAFT_129710 [Penicilliopsis zonata CBS 506.65]OJJ49279.1 hypothetical protein ASPZODRAFT_129710 [Penicilliopsis zonata CBS 506.65]